MNRVVLGPRYNLRVDDFSDHHVLIVQCQKCGHEGIVPATLLKLKAPAHERILDVSWRLRCVKCRLLNCCHWQAGEIVSDGDGVGD